MNFYSMAEQTENYSNASVVKASMETGKMLLLAIVAGMIIAFAGMATNMVSYALDNNSTLRLLNGVVFAFGLGMVILSGAELFTGNTLMIIGTLDRKITFGEMLRNWGIVFFGNFIGSIIVAGICATFGWLSAGSNALAAYSMKVSAAKISMPFQNAFFMGILCNVLVTLAVMFSLCAKDVTGRILGAYTPVLIFVICGFNHSIADMGYCALGILAAGNATYLDAASAAGVNTAVLNWGSYLVANLIPVTLGNIVGGVSVGAFLWYCHLTNK